MPIIPVGLAYSPAVHYGQDSFAQHLAKIASSERTRVAVFFGEPLRAELDSRAAAEAARTQVERLVVEARRALEDDSA